MMKNILLLALLFICLLMLLTSDDGNADPPSKIQLEYDYSSQILNVTITHSVGNPNEHYVYRVEVTKNTGTPEKYTYTSQPDDYRWTYSYDVAAEDGDQLKAQAFCNEGGDRSGTITVEHTDQPMDLFLSPDINVINENSIEEFTLSIESNSDPLEGAELDINAIQGEISDINELGGGDYTFRYVAPEVDSDEIDTINITASKRGYITTSVEQVLTIHNILENVSAMNITISPMISEMGERSTINFTVFVESEGAPIVEGILFVIANYGEVLDIMEVGEGNYSFSYLAPEVNGDVDEELTISLSKEGFETSYKTINLTILDQISSQSKICIFMTPDGGDIEQDSSMNFTIILEAACEPLDGANIGLTHSFGAVTNIVETGEGKYTFTYYAPSNKLGESETLVVSASKKGYRDNEQEFVFNIVRSTPGGDGDLDGTISPGEYDFSTSFGGGDFEVHWRFENDTIVFALVGKTTGWVSIGFDPEKAMENSDMILAWVDNDGEVHVVDAFSTGPTGPHPPDIELGGTEDILSYGGSEEQGVTVIEFQRYLQTNDPYDKDIPTKGKLKVIWSNGPTDEFYRTHEKSQRGTGTIIMDTGVSTEEDDFEIWPIHAFFMTVGLLSMLTGIYIARFKRKEKWWMKYHKGLGIMGSVFTIVGLLIGFYMVEDSTGEHFRVAHAYTGLIMIILAIITPMIGLLMFRYKKQIKNMKFMHRWLGRITALLMILTVLSGLSAAGVI